MKPGIAPFKSAFGKDAEGHNNNNVGNEEESLMQNNERAEK